MAEVLNDPVPKTRSIVGDRAQRFFDIVKRVTHRAALWSRAVRSKYGSTKPKREGHLFRGSTEPFSIRRTLSDSRRIALSADTIHTLRCSGGVNSTLKRNKNSS